MHYTRLDQSAISLAAQQQLQQANASTSSSLSVPAEKPQLIANSATSAPQSTTSSTTTTKYQSSKVNSAIDSLSSGWEESENESPNLSGDVSLLETKYRCMNLRQQHVNQQHQQQQLQHQSSSLALQNAVDIQAREATSSDNSPTTNRRVLASSVTPKSNTLLGIEGLKF